MDVARRRFYRARRPITALALAAVLLLVAGCGASAPRSTAQSGGSLLQPRPVVPSQSSIDLCTSTAVPFPSAAVDGGRYVVEPDEWNASGEFCVRTSGATGFSVSRSGQLARQAAAAPAAFPAISTVAGSGGLPIPVAALGDATSDWTTGQQPNGSFDVAYDLWFSPTATSCQPASSAELMIWLKSTDDVRPLGTEVPDAVSLAGADYQVYESSAGKPHSVISYARDQATASVRGLDLRTFVQDAVVRGFVPPRSYLCEVSAGFEVWSGGVGLTSDSFAFHPVVGLPSGAITSEDGGGACLGSGQPSASAGGRRAGLVGCGTAATPVWTEHNDGTLQSSGLCLSAPAAGGGRTVTVAQCTGRPTEQWLPRAGGELVNRSTGTCLDSAPGGVVGGPVLDACDGSVDQAWRLPYNGSSSAAA